MFIAGSPLTAFWAIGSAKLRPAPKSRSSPDMFVTQAERRAVLRVSLGFSSVATACETRASVILDDVLQNVAARVGPDKEPRRDSRRWDGGERFP